MCVCVCVGGHTLPVEEGRRPAEPRGQVLLAHQVCFIVLAAPGRALGSLYLGLAAEKEQWSRS